MSATPLPAGDGAARRPLEDLAATLGTPRLAHKVAVILLALVVAWEPLACYAYQFEAPGWRRRR